MKLYSFFAKIVGQIQFRLESKDSYVLLVLSPYIYYNITVNYSRVEKSLTENQNTRCASNTFPKYTQICVYNTFARKVCNIKFFRRLYHEIRETIDKLNGIWRQILRIACRVIAAKIQMESARRSVVQISRNYATD